MKIPPTILATCVIALLLCRCSQTGTPEKAAPGTPHHGSATAPQAQDSVEERPVPTKPLLYVGSVTFPPTQTDLHETQQDAIVVLMSRRLPLKYSGKLTASAARMELIGIVGRDDQSPEARRKARLRAAATRAYVLQAYEALEQACANFPQTISTVCVAADSADYAGDSLVMDRVDFVYYPEPPADTR
jgi:hypothetical protein